LTIVIIAVSWFTKTGTEKKAKTLHLPQKQTNYKKAIAVYDKLHKKAAAAKAFAAKKGYNEETCFLIDMTLPSGSNRFFIFNLKKDMPSTASLVVRTIKINAFHQDIVASRQRNFSFLDNSN
jgi:hypothetical protein